MRTGSVSFIAKTSGVKIQNFSVDSRHAKIAELECAISDDGKVTLNVNLEDVYCEDWPIPEVIQEIHRFFDVLSFGFECPIRNVTPRGHSLKKNDGSGNHRVASDIALAYDALEATRTLGQNAIQRVQELYRESHQSWLLRLYSAAIRQEDPVARFMFLYNIMLSISDDQQLEVDKKIRSVEPDTPITPSPFHPNVQETIYSRLRNEVAHKRGEADYVSTSREVGQQVAGLETITRNLISNTF